jgi:hypothetical protein
MMIDQLFLVSAMFSGQNKLRYPFIGLIRHFAFVFFESVFGSRLCFVDSECRDCSCDSPPQLHRPSSQPRLRLTSSLLRPPIVLASPQQRFI